ncbi:MAG: hypothetical protein COB23_09265 [Methylophaga sp.]|nr:MAG: hypothetical protein COB23_09265 [Methylophaga sp.]
MINQKYQPLVFSFFMSLFMSCIMSLVISIFNLGLASDIVAVWLKAWSFAFVVAFPTIMLMSPIVHKVVNIVVDSE